MESMAERTKRRAEKLKSFVGRHLIVPDGVSLLKPVKGVNLWDILPYIVKVDHHPDAKAGEPWYVRRYYTHKGVGPEEVTVICPTTIGKRCPICEEHARLRKNETADEDVVKGLRKKERELFNVFDTKNPDAGIQIFDTPTFFFSDMLEDHIRTGEAQKLTFWECQNGSTLKVTMGESDYGDALKAKIIEFVAREDYGDSVLELTHDLDSMLVCPTYEELQKLFLGLDEDAAPPAPAASARPPLKRPGAPVAPAAPLLRPGTRPPSPPTEQEALPPPNRPPLKRPGAPAAPVPPVPATRPGRKPAPPPPPEPEPPAEEAGAVEDGVCPSGHVFGVDTDEKPDCSTCTVWDSCKDLNDRNAAEAAASKPKPTLKRRA